MPYSPMPGLQFVAETSQPQPPNPSILPGFPTAPAVGPVPAYPASAATYPSATYPSAPYPSPAYPSPAYPATPVNLALHEQAYAAYRREPVGPPERPRRPRVLTSGVLTALAGIALTVASQALALRDGREAVRAAVETRLPGSSGTFPQIVAAAVDAAYRTIQGRATLSAVLAVLVAGLVLLALRAGLVTRIAAVTAMAVSGLVLMVCVLDVFPTPARAVGAAALVLHPAAAAMFFMPAVGRYRQARRSRSVRDVGAPLTSGSTTGLTRR